MRPLRNPPTLRWHEARTDWSMIVGLAFLAIVGGGRWSVDAHIGRRTRAEMAEIKDSHGQ
jgi:uncharacterized membrane protein YphA (DoxX/SURF4 family)